MRSVLFDVLEINIVAALVIVILCLLAGKLRKNYGATWLKIMWLVIIVRMLIPYNFSLPSTELRLFSVPGFEQEAAVTSETPIEIISEEAIPENPQPGVSLEHESGTETPEQVVSEPNLFVSEDYEEGNLQSKSSFHYTDILLCVWIAGIAVTGLYHLVIYVMLRQNYLRGLQPVHNEHLQEQIASLQIKYLGKVKLTAYESDKVDTPLLTGLLHPKLIIPITKSEWNAEELELVIAHELCHYRMKDLWLKQLMLLVTCVNWFNPAVYLMKKHFYHDMELVCDAHVMRGRSNDEKEAYAKILMSYAGKNRRNYTFMSGLAAGKKLTKNRIQHIWEDGRKKKGIVTFICIMVALLGISLFVSCGYKPEEVVKDAGGVSSGAIEPVEDESVSYGDEEAFAWEDVEGLCFQCLSADGKYPTLLQVAPDGSFSGSYKEPYPEDVGEEYPNGTIYLCNFDGKFAEPKKIDSYTYSLEVSEMIYEEHIGSKIYEDDIFYYYVPPVGLYDLEELVLYTPGAPLRELPVAFLESVGYQSVSLQKDATLPFYGIYNAKEEKGFFSFDPTEEALDVIGATEDFAPEETLEFAQEENSYLTQVEDPVYRDLITEMLDTGKFPVAGIEWSGNPYDNYYAITDVDVDGKDELIIYFPNGSCMAAMVYYVYDYDRTTNEPYIQCFGFPDFAIYENGYIIEKASHNHGRSNLDDFWPYRVHKYNENTDTYECIANMDAWQQEYNSGNSEFPKEKDTDGDGVVYYNWTADEWDKPSLIMDNAEYEMWHKEITQGNVIEITMYAIITQEAYYELYPQPEANG
ncbi:MAG: M56 family metallopeptidase [Lachnospiraceae bacterium]|nr:M56 family metallopeptidase [Lachnospiraceae bacterium]